jgi:tetratricopeptide (TPR) repeat protein
MPILRIVLLASLLVFPHAAASAERAAQWTKLQSEHFLFIGDADERTLRGIARKLERFRATLVRVLGEVAAQSPAPTVVLVFATEESFAPYRLRFNGTPVESRAFALASESVQYLALSARDDTHDAREIYHEYTHLLVNNVLGDAPDWLHEGLASFYETFEEIDEGRTVRIGRPAIERLAVARRGMMPLDALMTTTRFSATYNVGPERAEFYAQSWALVHYLLVHRAKGGQLPAYVHSGVTSQTAFASAFGSIPSSLERELETYVRRFTFPVAEFSFPEALAVGGIGRGGRIAVSEAQTYLADLLSLLRRPAAAEAALSRVLIEAPDTPRALCTLGLVKLQTGQSDVGMRLLERAAELAPEDSWIQGAWGRALGEQVRQARGIAGHAERVAHARTVLAKAADLSPASAGTLYQLALLELELGGDVTHARALLEAASALAPGRVAYRALLARLLIHQGESSRVPRAASLVSPAVRSPLTRAAARARPHMDAVAVEMPPVALLEW